VHGSDRACGPGMGPTQPPSQMAAEPDGRRGRGWRFAHRNLQGFAQKERRASRRTADTGGRFERGFPPSRLYKLARRRIAAGEIRRGCNRRGRRCKLQDRWYFGARGRLRAIWKSLMAERRTSVNRSPCGRRTSRARRQPPQPHSFSIPSPSN
jgi:hypothetical protein